MVNCKKTIGASERIREILAEDPELILNEDGSVEKLNITGNIRFDKVAFSYPAREDVESVERSVIEN